MFTPEVQSTIVEAAGKGLPLASCAGLARVSKHSLESCIQRGEENPDTELGQFAMAVREAQARFKLRLVSQIDSIGVETKQWAALMTLLERVFGDEFKRPSEKQTTNNINIGILEKRIHEIEISGDTVYDGG